MYHIPSLHFYSVYNYFNETFQKEKQNKVHEQGAAKIPSQDPLQSAYCKLTIVIVTFFTFLIFPNFQTLRIQGGLLFSD